MSAQQIRAWVVAIPLIFVFTVHCHAQAVSLPSVRIADLNDGAYTYLGAIAGPPTWSEDGDDILAYSAIETLYSDVDWGHIEVTATALADVFIAPNNATFTPEVDTSLITMCDAHLEASEEQREGMSESTFKTWANATFEISINPEEPFAGAGTLFSTMSGKMWLVATGAVNSCLTQGDLGNSRVLRAGLGGSFVEAYLLDSNGNDWVVEGTLNRSSSFDTGAAPENIINYWPGGVNELYSVSEATNVGVRYEVFGRVELMAWMRVRLNVPGYPDISSALDQRTFKAAAWYSAQEP